MWRLVKILFVVALLLAAGLLAYQQYDQYAADNTKPWPNKTPKDDKAEICVQVITPARNPRTGEVKDFSTPCDVPETWEKIEPQKTEDTKNEQTRSWQVYKNPEYGFELQYPPAYLTTGKQAKNSTLGTADDHVAGIYIGPIVLIPLRTKALQQKGQEYFANFDEIISQKPGENAEGLDSACVGGRFGDQLISIQWLHCAGEGGPAYYGYVRGQDIDFFFDGYSGGFDADAISVYGSSPGRYIQLNDFKNILASFRLTN